MFNLSKHLLLKSMNKRNKKKFMKLSKPFKMFGQCNFLGLNRWLDVMGLLIRFDAMCAPQSKARRYWIFCIKKAKASTLGIEKGIIYYYPKFVQITALYATNLHHNVTHHWLWGRLGRRKRRRYKSIL